MNISFLVTKDLLCGGGGIEKYTREVGRRLVARGHSVVVYSTRGDERGADTWEGLQIRWMPRCRPYWAEKMCGSFTASVLTMISTCRPDVLHLHSVVAGGMAPLLRLLDLPCVLQMHGVEWQRSRWGGAAKAALKVLEGISFSSATTVTAVSDSQCELYRARYRRPISFIPTGTEVIDPIPPRHLSAMNIRPLKYFLTAVRLVREKGVHLLIPAFRKCATDWTLVIAGGDGGDTTYSRYLRQLAAADKRVQFLGHANGPLLDELYSNAGAYVQASEIEGMSISLLDAMSFGRCCIVSNIPENLAVLGATGLTFRNGEIDDLAFQMNSVAHAGLVAVNLGEKARDRVSSQYSWESVTTKLEELYRDVTESRVPLARLARRQESV